MSKIIQRGIEAQNNIIKGIDSVADIVKVTVGPKGRNILVRNGMDIPTITNDGVTIAKSVQLKDNIEDAGAALIISAADKTNKKAGDGTTTTTILAQEMIHKFNEYNDNNTNVVQVQKEMLETGERISNYLLEKAIPVENTEDIKRVATISSGSETTGNMLATAFNLAGEYGSVIVEDSKTGTDSVVAIQGMKLTNGSVTPYLLNDRVNLKTELLNTEVLITKDKIDSVTEFIPILDLCAKEGRKLLIICEDIETEPLSALVLNKAKGAPLNISIIRLPGYGELREQLLEDLCIATGATLIGRDVGITFKECVPEYFGEAEQVIITMDETIIKFKDTTDSGVYLKSCREERVEELQVQLQNANETQMESLKRRISNLLSGISIVQVSGNSEVEIKDKKLRIEDAINSVIAAKEEGIVPGGGYSFLDVYNNIERKDTLGEKVVMNSLLSVCRQIAENSGKNGDDIVNKCLTTKKGYNALTDEFEELIETGVINSVKVDRYSLLNATSVASTVITMGGLIIDENEKDQNVLQLQTSGLPLM